ncbi:MAG: M48 family metalloprotease [Candidatus Melainabacteria bacterium]|nr:M48 family metalloprotease [Candidatus Melainabacteria bacterium]
MAMSKTRNSVGAVRTGSRTGIQILIALGVGLFSLFTYFSQTQFNEVTNEKQHVAISPRQEIALGLQSAPQMAAQFGGPAADPVAQATVTEIGNEIVARSDARKTPYKFSFQVLDDSKIVNAFALPGGPVFITEALYKRLKTRGQIAGVLGHEIGHVAARHSAEHLAKAQLTQGLTGAAVLATYDPDDMSSRNSAVIASLVGQAINMRYGRQDELESDKLGVKFMTQAGYDPNSMIEVMNVLKAASGSRTIEFFSTHPNPENRVPKIKEAIAKEFPNGVPAGLTQ